MAGGRSPRPWGYTLTSVRDGTLQRTESPRAGPLAERVWAANRSAAAAPVYDSEVHEDLTEVLALAAGFGIADAREIAWADQRVDVDADKQPLPGCQYDRRGLPYDCLGVERRRLWHFTTEARRAELKRQYKQSGGLTDLGTYMHVFQDKFSHKGLNYVTGQVGTSVDPRTGETRRNSLNPLDQAPWHEADDPSKNPGRAVDMARGTYDELVEAKEYLAERGKLRQSFEPVDYVRISGRVDRFCHEPDAAARKSIADEIGAFVLGARAKEDEEMGAEMRAQMEETERRMGARPRRKAKPKRRR